MDLFVIVPNGWILKLERYQDFQSLDELEVVAADYVGAPKILEHTALLKNGNMIYYIYKITFLCGSPEGRYYLGKRKYTGSDVSKDAYTGSGAFPKMYFKYFGKQLGITYIKEILEYNADAKINGIRESEIIGDLWKTDPLCMNKTVGGLGGEEFVEGSKVIQYDLHGIEIARYDSQMDAQSATGISHSSISQCCLGKNAEAGRFIWRFDVNPITTEELENLKFHSTPVKQYSMNGEFIKEWNSAKDVENELGINADSICSICNHKSKTRHSAGGFMWTFFNEELIIIKKKSFVGKRKVKQFTKDTHEFIQTFNSLSDAAKSVYGAWQHIQRCCNKIKPSAYGYYWEFEDCGEWNW